MEETIIALEKEELNSIKIEVSLLSAPKALLYKKSNDLEKKVRAIAPRAILVPMLGMFILDLRQTLLTGF